MELNFATGTKSAIVTWSLKICFLTWTIILKLQILVSLVIFPETLEMECYQQGVVQFHTWLRKFTNLRIIPDNQWTCSLLESFYLWWSHSISHFRKLWKKTTFTNVILKTDQIFSGKPCFKGMAVRTLSVQNSWIWSIACSKLTQFTDHLFMRSLHMIGARAQHPQKTKLLRNSSLDMLRSEMNWRLKRKKKTKRKRNNTRIQELLIVTKYN